MFTWIQAYLTLVAALSSDKATIQYKLVGFLTHQYIILQMAEELSSAQAIKYNQEFCEWAVAKRIRFGES